MKPLEVVCALIVNSDGKFLACQRSSETSLAGKWEFPGGKIEPGESAQAALTREILEELEVNISILRPLSIVMHRYPGFEIALSPFLCEINDSEVPNALEHSQIRWVNLAESIDLEWSEADIPIIQQYEKLIMTIMKKRTTKLIIFDCDSTLSAIEGIDELAREKGAEVFSAVVALTNAAMNGEVQLDEVFARRLEIIQPDLATCQKIEQLYIDTVEPTALETISAIKQLGYTPIILSGGFKRLIEPLAEFLGIERVEAVPLHLDTDGNYVKFDSSYPTTYNGGKPEIIAQFKEEFSPERIIMVGDGVSDLETKAGVDLFVGYGKYTDREKVREGSDHFIYSLADLLAII
ncbi:MAG: phosphoserine phosphatase [Cryomorphaceae bacterium]|jgi:phosphoserine phosphatase